MRTKRRKGGGGTTLEKDAHVTFMAPVGLVVVFHGGRSGVGGGGGGWRN